MDALKKIIGENHVRPESIEKIEIRTSKATKLHVGWPYSPESITSAQMNLYYSAAACALEGDAFIDQFTEEKIKDPKILSFIPKVEIEEDPDLTAGGPTKRHSVRVKVRVKEGGPFEEKVDFPKGNPKNPMTRSDVEAKFRKLTGKVFPATRIDQIIAAVDRLETMSDAGELLRLLS
jgi:aconitate decarboxylase